MPKVKTHSGAQKRFKKLKSGKFKAAHAGRRKKLAQKTAKRKRFLRTALMLCHADTQRIRCVMPY